MIRSLQSFVPSKSVLRAQTVVQITTLHPIGLFFLFFSFSVFIQA